MEKWHYYMIISILLGLIFTLCLSAWVFFAYAKPNSTEDNCTLETTPIQPPVENTINPAVQKAVDAIKNDNSFDEDNAENETEKITEEQNETKEETPIVNNSNEKESYEAWFNSLSPEDQIKQRENEKAEEAALKDTKKDSHNEDDISFSEPLENVDASESITKENKMNSEAVSGSTERTDFVSHQVDGNKITFNSSYYIEMKIGKNGIVNFGEELEGAEIIVIPK